MEERHIGVLLKLITDRMKNDADADFKKYDLTFTQSRVLVYLNGRSETTQKELEDYLCVSHPTIVGIISRMERNGYVRCWFDPQDKRNKMIALTEKAITQGKEMERMTEQREQDLVSALTEKQIADLKEALLLIYKSFT